MKTYRIECLEKFVVRTVYEVEAETKDKAVALVKDGDAAYDNHKIEEGDEDFLGVQSVEELD